MPRNVTMTPTLVQLYQTAIVRREENLTVTFNCGGWHTRTTAKYMNEYIKLYLDGYDIKVRGSNGMLYVYTTAIDGNKERFSLYHPMSLDLNRVGRVGT